MIERSDMSLFMVIPYFINVFPCVDRSVHVFNFFVNFLSLKCCRTSCALRIRVRSLKSVYLAHAFAYLSVWAMNTPYEDAWGTLPDKSGKFTILNGKSSRLSYSDVTNSLSTTSMLRSRYVAFWSFLLFSCFNSSSTG